MEFYLTCFFATCTAYLLILLTTPLSPLLLVAFFDGPFIIGYLALEAVKEALRLKSTWEVFKIIFGGGLENAVRKA